MYSSIMRVRSSYARCSASARCVFFLFAQGCQKVDDSLVVHAAIVRSVLELRNSQFQP
jgi:hypothetical protein